MNSFHSQHFSDKQAGFTLIEMLVVAAIIVFLSTSLITNFSRSRINVDQSSNLFMAVVRDTQSKAVSSTVYNSYNPCGYGIHYISATQFSVYVGPNASTTDCASINKNYQSGQDTIVETRTFNNSQIEIKTSFYDIFFLPPDPKTYINNDASLNGPQVDIQIGVAGTACPENCRTISIYPSGKIESQ